MASEAPDAVGGQGPFDKHPHVPVPHIDGIYGSRSKTDPSRGYENDENIRANYWRWAQARDGKWYAFYANIGPGRSWNTEHDTDPNWWRLPGPTGASRGWSCRHGFAAAVEGCQHGCGPEPVIITDEEFEQYRNIVLKSLHTEESK